MSEKLFDIGKMLQNAVYFLKNNGLCMFSCMELVSEVRTTTKSIYLDIDML